MEHQMPCFSSAPDNWPVQVIEIEDDSTLSSAEPRVELIVANDTSREQEATNVTEGKIHAESTLNSAQRRTENEDDATEGEIHAESTLNSGQRGTENEDDVTEGEIDAQSTLNSVQRGTKNEDDVTDGEIHARSTPSSAQRVNKRKTPYSIDFAELPEALRKFLAVVRRFFTQKVNFEREKAPVALSTYEKAQERMLCFLGYARSTLARDVELLPNCFLRIPLIEGYVEFLKGERNCSSATVSNHISSLLYPIKFVHREHAPDFKGVPIIRQLRVQARILQKEGDLERPSTVEDLSAQNRWIPWEEVVSAVSTQREKFELTGPMNFKAKEFCDLIMLSLYVFIPPSRGLEIRTLEVLSGEEARNFDPKSSSGKNYLLVKDSGGIVLHFNNYKTRKFSGRDELTLQPEDELCRLLLSYIKDYRPHLVTESSQNYLLLNRSGGHFTAAAFSAHLKSVLYGLTGKMASINILRSSFITWAYDKSDCTDSLKVSLASALRHSRKQAQTTYDRRTANQKKRLAVNLARDYAEGRLDEEEHAAAGESEEGGSKVNRGDFVAVVTEESTCQRPKVFIGQVQSVRGTEATLLYYKHIGTNLYKLELSVEEWKEGIDGLVPVQLQATKKRAGVYKLMTSPRTIHKAVKA